MIRECGDYQALYLVGEPESFEHVSVCSSCRSDMSDLDAVASLLNDPATWVEPRADLGERVEAAILRSTSNSVVPHIYRPSWRRLWGIAVAACLVGIGLSLGIVAAFDRAPRADLTVALSGTRLAPDARARADLRSAPGGVEIRLHMSGLPRARSGFFYEAWVKGGKGAVPIGTFHTGTDNVVLWSGVMPSDYPTLTVTLEPEDGNPASSGQQVLVGSIEH